MPEINWEDEEELVECKYHALEEPESCFFSRAERPYSTMCKEAEEIWREKYVESRKNGGSYVYRSTDH